MKLAIATVPRTPGYLSKTLESLEASGFRKDIHLFLGRPDQDYLQLLHGLTGIYVHDITGAQWNEIKGFRDFQKYVGNFVRILEAFDEDLFIAEDDVLFHPRWQEELDILRTKRPRKLISLYSAADYSGEKRFVEKHHFYGTCGIFYPNHHRRALATLLRKRLSPDVISVDDLINEYLKDNREIIVISTPSWIDHLGESSSIQENRGHGLRRAPTFNGDSGKT